MNFIDLTEFEARLASENNPLKVFREILKQGNEELKQAFYDGRPVPELIYQRAALIDQLLINAWKLFMGKIDDIALVAVGGYGRGELHPCSDIDLMILLPNEYQDIPSDEIESFLMFLWDIGLEVGHSVRNINDCIEQAAADITIATNLMESRLICGPENLYAEMCIQTGPDKLWPGPQFFEAKLQEQIARHHKFDDSAYNLEPNIKEGPGGLRDIQMIGWVAKRHFGATTMHDLVSHGFLTENEYHQLIKGQSFLWKIRFALHSITGRREDRLLFNHQRTLAQHFAYEDTGHHLAVELFMKDFYREVMELNRLNEMLLQLFQEEILLADDSAEAVKINNRFQARKGYIEVRHQHVFKRYPFALLEIFLLLQQNPDLKGVRAGTIRLIRDHRYLIDDEFRHDLKSKSLFMEILRQSSGIAHELKRMNSYGILAAYLPVFKAIVGQMQHDLFHCYTVDEHTLFVIRNLRRFSVPDYAHELPLCSAIFYRLPKPELLYISGIFHDIAKGRGGDHSELGASDAQVFCEQHSLSSYDSKLVSWLVKNHLLMSTTSQRKDISDPEVINDFAATVSDQNRLYYLYLLTVADIRATSPSVWNSWKDALLMELYTATTHALHRGLENPLDHQELVENNQSAAIKELIKLGFKEDAIYEHWKSIGDEYFLHHSPEEIIWHTEAILQSTPEQLPLLLINPKSIRGGTEIFIFAKENLFAQCASIMEQLELTVADARIITTSDNYYMDTYIVLEASGKPITDKYRIDEIKHGMQDYLNQPYTPLQQISRNLPRRLKHFDIPTEVIFRDDSQKQRTIMEVITSDRPGVLARIGLALSQCKMNLLSAKIATFGERVEDIFFILDKNYQPLNEESQLTHLRDKVIEHLNR
jgi:[protein-PII] uridylyltransferase